MRKKQQYLINIPNIGIMKYSTFKETFDIVKDRYIKTALTKFLKTYKLTIMDYINLYIMPLQKCGFCNTHLAIYNYDLEIVNNTLIIKNIHIQNNYMCNDKTCKKNRKKLNPNSLEHIAKRKKLSLEEADKWQKANNNSPFYLHPGQSKEEYAKRQSRNIDYFVTKYGKAGYDKFESYCKKLSIANSKETVINKYGEQYNINLQNSKKNTLSNFIKRYGEQVGKEKYKQWILKCTHVGMYINNKKIHSKQAYQFFIELEQQLILNNICQKNDILYADGYRNEYTLTFFQNNKLKYYKLDFTILKYKIDIEFNGRRWHYDLQNNQKNNNICFTRKPFKLNQIKRNNIITNNGFKMFIVWDDQVIINKKQQINNLILNIKQYIKETCNESTF